MKNLKNIEITNYLDIIMTSFITLLLVYTGQTIGFTILFQFIPLTVLILKYGYIEYFISFILSFIGSIFIFDISMSIFIFTYILTMTLAISFFIKKNKDIFQTSFNTSIISIIFIGISIVLINKIYNVNVMNELKMTLDGSIKPIEEILENNIEFDKQQIDLYINSLREIFKYLLKIIPGIFIVSSFIISLLNTLFSIKFLEKIGYETKYNTNISEISLGKYILKFIIGIAFVYIIVEILQIKNKNQIIDNLTFIMDFALVLNGLLVVHNILKRMFNKFISYLIIFMFLIIFQGGMLFSIVGFVDTFFDFRKRLIIRKRGR